VADLAPWGRSSVDALAERAFGHATLRPHQRAAIDAVAAGRDALVLLPTGAGKSLCYQLPALALHQAGLGTTLVLSPLVALMEDQVRAMRARGVAAACLHHGVQGRERARLYRQLAAGELALLFAVPERLRDGLFLERLSAVAVPLVAVDEAHCVSLWGQDFRPDYGLIGARRDRVRTGDGAPPPMMALTATATPRVRADIEAKLGLRSAVEVRAGVVRPNLRLEVEAVHGVDGKVDAVARLLAEVDGPALIYTGLIVRGEQMRAGLRERGIDLPFYNGDMERRARRRLGRRFIEAPAPVLLATNAFGMGIDRPDVRLIIHTELPGGVAQWAQEIGRAGRDGAPARIVTLLDADDLAIQQQHIFNAHPDAALHAIVYDLVAELDGQAAGWRMEALRKRVAGRDRRDHRADTVLRRLEAVGSVRGRAEEGRIVAVQPPQVAAPDAHWLEQAAVEAARHAAHERLLALYRLLEAAADAPAGRDNGLWDGVAAWFDAPDRALAKQTDAEHAAKPAVWSPRPAERLAELQPAAAGALPPAEVQTPAGTIAVGDFVMLRGGRFGEVIRASRRPDGVAQLRVQRVDDLREIRVLVRGPEDVTRLERR
jgi:ATP-dependent DNA helicase RecQ